MWVIYRSGFACSFLQGILAVLVLREMLIGISNANAQIRVFAADAETITHTDHIFQFITGSVGLLCVELNYNAPEWDNDET